MRLRTWFLRLCLLSGVILAALAVLQLRASSFGASRRALVAMGIFGLSGLIFGILLGLSWTPRWQGLQDWALRLQSRVGKAGWLAWVALAVLSLGLPLAVLWATPRPIFATPGPRLWLLWLLVLGGAALIQSRRPGVTFFEGVLAALALDGVVLLVCAQAGAFSGSVFSLGWSEASRYYNASLFFSPLVYGRELALPTLHPTRYFLEGLAFLIPGSTIAFQRLWQVLLWLGCSGLAAWALVRRLKLEKGLWAWIAAGWAFAFFFVGPIYYHLILCAVPVLLWFDRRRFGRTLLIVVLASAWAGVSRINWYPVPGALALLLYLFEEPQGERPFWKYLLAPAAWVITGTGVAFATSQVYIALSGNPPEVFGSAFSSPLLWYRMFPNSTYGPGILEAAATAFLPVLVLLAGCLVPWLRRWKPIRLLGIAGVLGAFLAAGIVVSAKIGGGGDLHNLDNFVLFLGTAALYLFSGRFQPDRPQASGRPLQAVLAGLGLLVMLLTVLPPALSLQAPYPPHLSPQGEAQVIARLQALIDQYQAKGPVLFLTERQLVTFHNLQAPNFEPEYEKVFLMEMAMANNPAYLGRFAAEMKAHKFSLIIAEPLNATIQGPDRAFSEENNAWVEHVDIPLLENYTPIETFNGVLITVYAPK